MICPGCGCVFCPDPPDRDYYTPRVYCTKACKKRAKERRAAAHRKEAQRQRIRQVVTLHICATRRPPKPRYESEGDALLAAEELGREPPLYAYERPCGWWHLTSRAPEESDLDLAGKVRPLYPLS